MSELERAAEAIHRSPRVAVLTGAGISVASGIPDFRSADGLWSRYDPAEYATLRAFRSDPRKVWRMLEEMVEMLDRARPNRAHRALARLCDHGLIEAVVTQIVPITRPATPFRRRRAATFDKPPTVYNDPDLTPTVPGVTVTFGQPISHRIDHMISGSQSNLAVKIFGPDLSVLRGLARQVEDDLGLVARCW